MWKKSLWVIPCLLLLVGCGADGFEPVDLEQTVQAAGSVPVQLYFVRATSRWDAENWEAMARMSGYIRIENLAYHKRVTVRYQASQSGEWRDLPAGYLRSLDDSKEVWFFESEEVSYPMRLSADFRLAISYEVNGHKYWDNNQGQDYRISTGPRPLYPTDLVLGRSLVALSKARVECSMGVFGGELVVRNLAPHKEVDVVYTTDGWQTVEVAPAGYMHPHTEDSELWLFSIDLDPDRCAQGIEFAIRYAVEGLEAWDNNFRVNYTY